MIAPRMNATITAYFRCFASQSPVTTPILERKNATIGVSKTQAHPEKERKHEVRVSADGWDRSGDPAAETQQEPHRRGKEDLMSENGPRGKGKYCRGNQPVQVTTLFGSHPRRDEHNDLIEHKRKGKDETGQEGDLERDADELR